MNHGKSDRAHTAGEGRESEGHGDVRSSNEGWGDVFPRMLRISVAASPARCVIISLTVFSLKDGWPQKPFDVVSQKHGVVRRTGSQ